MATSSGTQARFARALLEWYARGGRDLPWRSTKDPYAIWVSEIMLQQTQVATVLSYYQRFLKAFPDIPALAAANLESVLMLWQGLGYYARARNLHKAAQRMVAQHQGLIPEDFKTLLALPGIGRSSAGAISSIAFGQRHPILDGNVRRVLCRFFGIEADPKDKAATEELWALSESLLPQKDAGLFQQAIMDLGATCCLPKQPCCPRCPVSSGCAAFQRGLQAVLPLKASRKKSPHFAHFAAVLIFERQVLIQRRPLSGLLGGLWEFPGARVGPASERPDTGAACTAFLKREMALTPPLPGPWMKINHVFTHFKMTLHVFSLRLKSRTGRNGLPQKEGLKWIPLSRLREHPFSAAHLKIASRLLEAKPQQFLFQ